MNSEITKLCEILAELKEDATVPKNVREKLENAITLLKEETEMQIKISKVLHELEEAGEDVNLQPYTRTQLWDVVSTLEKLNKQ